MRCAAGVLTGLMACGVAGVAHAEIVTLTFSAPLDSVSPRARNIFTLGDLATIRYSFEANAAASSSSPTSAGYMSISSLELTIQLATGGVYTARATRGLVQVDNNISGYGLAAIDHYFAGATDQRPVFDLVAPDINGFRVTGVYLSLWDANAAAFTSVAQPRSLDPARFNPGLQLPLEGISLRFQAPGGPDFVSASLTPRPGTLSAPANLRAEVSGSFVLLSWTPTSAAAVGYLIEAGSTSGASNLASVTIGPVIAFTAPGVPNGLYYIRVRALGGASPGPPSNEVVVDVGGVGTCGAPPGAATLASSLAGSLLTLTWTPGAGCAASSFVLYAGTAPGLSNVAVVNMGTATFLTASVPAGTYYVRVVAQNAFGASAPSNEVVVQSSP